jgi:peptidoglycan hydrolase-like protein with peptidoglycan-binding domain
LEGGQPRANEHYRLRVDHCHFQGVTDGDGNIDVVIPPYAFEGELVVGSTEVLQRTYRLQFGGMDPIHSVSGVQKRLRNLGYNCPLTGRMDDKTAAEIAIFQNDHDLETTGVVDDDTLRELESAHAS